ncbi:MAG: hypothetical protein NTZ05_00895 [Chloroflexi bacterium]|nr:hypothetical protein [Chloroflexota bacterium]
MVKQLGLAVLGVGVMASQAMAQVFPVDATSTTTIANIKTDVIAWGVVFIGVSLAIFAYKRIKSLVR